MAWHERHSIGDRRRSGRGMVYVLKAGVTWDMRRGHSRRSLLWLWCVVCLVRCGSVLIFVFVIVSVHVEACRVANGANPSGCQSCLVGFLSRIEMPQYSPAELVPLTHVRVHFTHVSLPSLSRETHLGPHTHWHQTGSTWPFRRVRTGKFARSYITRIRLCCFGA